MLESSSKWQKGTLEFNTGDLTAVCVLLIGWDGGGDAIIDNVVLAKKGSEPVEPDQPDQPDQPDEPDTTVYTYEHSYINADVFAEAKELYESKKASVNGYWLDGAPYVLADVFGLSNSTLKSITIPVLETKAADADGNFVFTLSVFKNDLESIKNSTPKSYAIKISAEEYGLATSAKDIYKMITVDLTPYEIKLAADECIAVASKSDTIVPAYLGADDGNSNPLYN
jgi:hypothetical protein